MKNNITELVFILDRSGSMSGFEADTIGGFNSTIGIAAVVILALVAIYKILEFLFVAAILLIGWIGIVPRRWR